MFRGDNKEYCFFYNSFLQSVRFLDNGCYTYSDINGARSDNLYLQNNASHFLNIHCVSRKVGAASPPPGERSEPLQSLTIVQNMLVPSNIFQKHNI